MKVIPWDDNVLVYQSPKEEGKEENGEIAADLLTFTKDKGQLYAMSAALGDAATTYDMPPASSVVLPPQGPDAVCDNMRELADCLCTADSEMHSVAREMIEHFIGEAEHLTAMKY